MSGGLNLVERLSDHCIENALDLFANAVNWKACFASLLRPLISGRVLEVGAGCGGSTAELNGDAQEEWICHEPDADLCNQIDVRIKGGEFHGKCSTFNGTLEDLSGIEVFDTILNIDVLEHI